MKAQLISDVHCEFLRGTPLNVLNKLEFAPDLDFLILAGDIFVPAVQPKEEQKSIFDFLSSKARHVIYTTGNHEYYHSDKETTEAAVQAVLPENVHWLQNSDVTLDGVHFFGGTLWFPFDPLNFLYEKGWSDFEYIKRFQTWVYKENTKFREWAYSLVRPETVVVSHYLPSYKAVADKYKGDASTRFFVSDESPLILAKQPRYWVFGHTHTSCDFTLGDTRFLCNPRGYPKERLDIPYPPVVFEL